MSVKSGWVKVKLMASRDVFIEVPQAEPSDMKRWAEREAMNRLCIADLDCMRVDAAEVFPSAPREEFRKSRGIIYLPASTRELELMAQEMNKERTEA